MNITQIGLVEKLEVIISTPNGLSSPVKERLSLVETKKRTQDVPSSSLFFKENPNIAEIFKIKEGDITINLIQQHETDYWLKDDEINIFEKLFDWLDKKMSKLDINVPKITVLNICEVIFVLEKYGFDMSGFLDLFKQFKINLYKTKASFGIEYHKKYTNKVAIFVDDVEQAVEELKNLGEDINDFELGLAEIKIITLKSRVRNDIDYLLYAGLSVSESRIDEITKRIDKLMEYGEYIAEFELGLCQLKDISKK